MIAKTCQSTKFWPPYYPSLLYFKTETRIHVFYINYSVVYLISYIKISKIKF